MAKAKMTLTVEAETRVLLQRTGNASRYIDASVAQRESQWRGALHLVRSGGWADSEIAAVCEILTGYQPPGLPLNHHIFRGMASPQCLADVSQLNTARWEYGARSVQRDPELARALWIIAQEYHAGNAAVSREIGRPVEDDLPHPSTRRWPDREEKQWAQFVHELDEHPVAGWQFIAPRSGFQSRRAEVYKLLLRSSKASQWWLFEENIVRVSKKYVETEFANRDASKVFRGNASLLEFLDAEDSFGIKPALRRAFDEVTARLIALDP